MNKSLDGKLPVGKLLNVEGRNLFCECSGTGGPTVVFIPAAGMVGLDYLNLHDNVRQHTTSLIYDRAGTGWSDPVKLPRTAAEVTDELRSLLHAAAAPAPYLFVGHSLGGLYARRYAQRFPDETAGLLLLEPAHEDFLTHTPKIKKRYMLQTGLVILRTLLSHKKVFRGLFEQMFAKWPDSIRETLIAYHLRTLSKTVTERKNLSEIYDETRNGGTLPDIPIIVYTAAGIDPFMAPMLSKSALRDTIDPFNDVKNKIYRQFANSVPRGEHRILNDAGHTTIHTDHPDSVNEAIRNLLDRVKSSKSAANAEKLL